jgi:hypothetical protein
MFLKFLLRRLWKRAVRKLFRQRVRLSVEPLEDRAPPATITWESSLMDGGGNWSGKTNWAGGTVPGAADTARFMRSVSAPLLTDNVGIAGLLVWAPTGAGLTYTTTLDLKGKSLTATDGT